MELLGGRYETLRAIASGGMAMVHLGRAVGVGGFERLVAIKVMHPHIASEPEFVDMFLDEARLAARIRHPNVVATIDVQTADDGLFLVMEFVDGPSLGALRKAAAKSKTPIPIGVTVRIMLDTLAGLHEAHELTDDEGEPLNLVHRDVTPANILVGVDGVVRLTDFGVARAEARLSSTRGGQLKGKIPFMPPEQLLGEPMDRRCDVYAAAAVLWEGLSGRRLFRAESDGRLVQMIINGAEHSPRELDPSVPEMVDQVCMRGLAIRPADRYRTTSAFAEALEMAAESDGVNIATPRAVAAFVERSGAHKRLDPKELAALKRGAGAKGRLALPSSPSGAGSAPGSGALVAGSWPSGSLPAAESTPSGDEMATKSTEPDGSAPIAAPADDGGSSPAASQPDLPPPAHESSVPSQVSSVTATDAIISTQTALPGEQRRRTPLLIGAGAAIAVAAIAGGLLFARADDAESPAPAGEAAEADEIAPPAVSDEPATDPTESPVASAEPSASATSAASAAASTSKAATPAPPKTAPAARWPRPPAAPKPTAAKPPPVSTSYNPDRL